MPRRCLKSYTGKEIIGKPFGRRSTQLIRLLRKSRTGYANCGHPHRSTGMPASYCSMTSTRIKYRIRICASTGSRSRMCPGLVLPATIRPVLLCPGRSCGTSTGTIPRGFIQIHGERRRIRTWTPRRRSSPPMTSPMPRGRRRCFNGLNSFRKLPPLCCHKAFNSGS